MPGWAIIIEMLSRGKHYPADLLQVFRFALTAGDTLPLLKRSICLASVTQHLSLAATVRKLVWPYVQHETQQAGKRTLVHLLPHADQTAWHDEQMEKFKEVQMYRLLHTLLIAVIELDHQLEDWKSACQNSSKNSSSVSSNNPISGGSNNPICRNTIGSSCGVTQPNPSRISSAHKPFTTGFYLHQLQVVSGVTLIQICLWLHEIELTRPGFHHESQGWVGSVLVSSQKLHNPHLQSVMVALLGEMSNTPPRQCERAGVTWERYATAHFDGQLLPGCCNLGCTDLTGVSEAKLKAKFCSGCRKARYCTVECQRAAWLDGGHSAVCGVHVQTT